MIEWKGGECPVRRGTSVWVKFRGGLDFFSSFPESFRWAHDGTTGDIIGYKVVEPQVTGSMAAKLPAEVRAFDTGATRSSEVGRYDPEGFLSPIAIERYCQYMNKNRVQPDGTTRDSDNWQRGIPQAAYVKGLLRHVLHLWTRHRGYEVQDLEAAVDVEEDLCAILFNTQGMLHEVVKARLERTK